MGKMRFVNAYGRFLPKTQQVVIGGVNLLDFESLDGFVAGDDTEISLVNDSLSGNHSLEIKNVNDDGWSNEIYVDIDKDIDLSKINTLSFDVYIRDTGSFDFTDNCPFKVMIKQGATFDNALVFDAVKYPYTWSRDNPVALANGWNQVKFHIDDATTVGSVNLKNTFSGIRIMFSDLENQLAIARLDNLRINDNIEPTVLLMFDDGEQSVYDVVLPYIQNKNIKIIVPINSARVGTTATTTVGDLTYMDLPELKEIYSKGHEIINHTETHPNLIEITAGEVKNEIANCRDYIIDNDMASGANFIAFPFNATNRMVDLIAEEEGVLLARAGTQGLVNVPPVNNLNLHYWFAPSHNSTNQTVETFINYVTKYKMTGVLLAHAVVEGAENEYFLEDSVFKHMIDYILTNKVKTLTCSEYYNKYRTFIEKTDKTLLVETFESDWVAEVGTSVDYVADSLKINLNAQGSPGGQSNAYKDVSLNLLRVRGIKIDIFIEDITQLRLGWFDDDNNSPVLIYFEQGANNIILLKNTYNHAWVNGWQTVIYYLNERATNGAVNYFEPYTKLRIRTLSAPEEKGIMYFDNMRFI